MLNQIIANAPKTTGIGLIEVSSQDGIESLLVPNGEYKIPSCKDLIKFSTSELAHFGHNHAMYTLPTIELVSYLKQMIGGRTAIEIGSGVGVLGHALNIKCTDNFCQDRPEVKAHYKKCRQPTINYGRHVLKRDAEYVARKYRPDIIIGSWITHKWVEGLKDGNMYGPNEEIILDNCLEYIMLGNLTIHRNKPILKHDPEIIRDLPFYITRSQSPEWNVIFKFKGRKYDK